MSNQLKFYYPLDFEIDLNGHKQEWKGVVKLPFMDLKVLCRALDPLWDDENRWIAEER